MATTFVDGTFSMTTETSEYMVTEFMSDLLKDNGTFHNDTMDLDDQSMYDLSDSNNITWFNFSTRKPLSIGPQDKCSLTEFILRLVVLIITLLGNALVLYAYATTKKLRTYTNYYVVGLAVADFFSGGVVPIMELYHSFLGYWPFTEAACTCKVFIVHVFLQATFLMTVVICYDRFRALNMPLKHLKEKSMRHACFLISMAYTIPVLLWTPIIVVFPYVGLATRIRPPLCRAHYALHASLLIFTVLVLSWIPMLVTSILYVFVYSAIIRRGVNKKRGIGEEASSTVKSDNQSVSRAATDEAPGLNTPTDRCNRASHSQTAPHNKLDVSKNPVFSVSAGLSVGLTNLAFEQTEDNDDGNHTKNHPEITVRRPISQETAVASSAKRPSKRPGETLTKHPGGLGVSGRKTRATTRSSKQENRLAILRATRTLTYIMLTMIVTALPWSIFGLWAAIDPYTLPLRGRGFPIISWLASLSSTINPLCYAASNPLFKAAFFRILWSQRIRNASGCESQSHHFSQSRR